MVNFPLLCWFFTECKVFWVPRSKHDVVFSLVSLTHEIAPQSQAGAKAGHLQGYLQGSMGSQFDPGYLLYIYIYMELLPSFIPGLCPYSTISGHDIEV